MTDNLLLDTYLKQLRLPTFLQNYRKFAEDAAQADLTYDRFLLSLAEQEVTQREINREARRIKAARFPVLKELADFDFSCITSPGKQQILDLARGAYLQQIENIILVGNPGLGKTHVSIGLALAACRQGHKVRFFNAAALVNELIIAQENHLLPQLITKLLKFNLVVIDELGFIPLSTQGAAHFPVLFRPLRTHPFDHHHQFALRRLDPGFSQRTTYRCSTRSPHSSLHDPRISRRIIPLSRTHAQTS